VWSGDLLFWYQQAASAIDDGVVETVSKSICSSLNSVSRQWASPLV
jgi:hypothetical protein